MVKTELEESEYLAMKSRIANLFNLHLVLLPRLELHQGFSLHIIEWGKHSTCHFEHFKLH